MSLCITQQSHCNARLNRFEEQAFDEWTPSGTPHETIKNNQNNESIDQLIMRRLLSFLNVNSLSLLYVILN